MIIFLPQFIFRLNIISNVCKISLSSLIVNSREEAPSFLNPFINWIIFVSNFIIDMFNA